MNGVPLLVVAKNLGHADTRMVEKRYGELIRLEACDFNPDAGTLAIRQSKSGKPRHMVLTEEGAAFFGRHCAGCNGHELMFRHDDGGAWRNSEQARPMAEACTNGKIKPAISFHILRHTWASHARPGKRTGGLHPGWRDAIKTAMIPHGESTPSHRSPAA